MIFKRFVVFFQIIFVFEGPALYTSAVLFKGNTLQVLNQTINEYLGISYAVPPVGSLRFAKPKPIVFEKVINFLKSFNYFIIN